MTAVRDTATSPNPAETSSLETEARALADEQRNFKRASWPVSRAFGPPQLGRFFERAHSYLGASSAGDAAPAKPVEWYLDNYYLIRRVARQVEEDLRPGFIRHLPHFASGPEKVRPRIDGLAGALVARTCMALELAVVRRFVDAYQEVSALTIAELWALPAMLRIVVLQHLLRFLDELHVPVYEGERSRLRLQASHDEGGSRESLRIDPGLGVERSVRALRVLDAIDWRIFFEKTNRVDAILRTDPANVYVRMDFETCDSYRKVVEALAWATGTAEETVASLAVALACDNASNERRGRGHVGYYLVAEGRRILEHRIGYRSRGVERVRRLATSWPTVSYLLPLALLTWIPLLSLTWCLATSVGHGTGPLLAIIIAAVLAIVPASAVAITFLQLAFACLLPPRTLPKLDFTKGLPSEIRALVVMPTLLGRVEDVASMTAQLELHYLSNPDPQLQFALLTDHLDARTQGNTAEDLSLLDLAARRITALNVKHGKDGHGPFHLLHRTPRWNPSEERFMGWERKRGKIEELNRLLRGDTQTSYRRHVGDAGGLVGVRFVITLDRDTDLPMGSAHRLVGLLAHPLNRAVFDENTGRVIAGYTIVQPRIETSPASVRQTLFSRVFAGDIGFDIYTHACSELYQDLFGSGIYVGKGIYDVDAFMRSAEGRAPENAIVSHDLFEGIHGRTALATDILLFESYPPDYATYSMRMHRWLRGDWQLFPWLFPKVPSARGACRNELSLIDRWKIADNLRRSLAGPTLFALLLMSWLWLPGSAWLWTLGVLALLLAPLGPALATGRHMRLKNLGRCAFAVVFLAYEACVAVDAVVRVFIRATITRKRLLQWTSAAHAAFGMNAQSLRALFWSRMLASPLLAIALAGLVLWVRPLAFVVAAPLLSIWLLAPEVARWANEPVRSRAKSITDGDRRKLRLLARQTWRFFDVFVGPSDQWLPVDNYQEEPREQTAHRTSPTNIGLMLVATLSAYSTVPAGERFFAA